jgi:crotonobetainyl-CoA:carnitine CoA-transferase CaiB-like acyl-CoA transferase
VYEWEQVKSQGLLVDVEHPVLGRLRLPGPPLLMEDADGHSTARAVHIAPPLLGEHGQQIREWLEGDPVD